MDNHGTPQGPKGLSRDGRGAPAEALESARVRLRELIQENVKPVPRYQVEIAGAVGAQFIVATISQGQSQPYSRQGTNDVYIRKGATNRLPDPQTEMPASTPSVFNTP